MLLENARLQRPAFNPPRKDSTALMKNFRKRFDSNLLRLSGRLQQELLEMKYLIFKGGYKGDLFFMNPRYDELFAKCMFR